MSGLQKFQANEVWRKNFKKFLFMERKPEVFRKALSSTESDRYSLDIDEDLKNIIEQKINVKISMNVDDICTSNIACEINRQETTILKSDLKQKEDMSRKFNMDESLCGELPMWQKISDESFEILEKMCEKTVSDPNNTIFKYLNDKEEQKSNNVLVWQKTSDESFEALEIMCDKTASDPNSTLFQYLHSDRKEQILAEVKKRSADGNVDSVHAEEDKLLMKLNNCTLLDDVEAPSRMWENSICSNTVVETSPIKMVGLLRPSTIIEEAPDDSNSDISSQMSFRTATKGVRSDLSSSTYDSAHDLTTKKDHQNELEIVDIDRVLFSSLAKLEQETKEQGNKIAIEKANTTIVTTAAEVTENEKEQKLNVNDVSLDLINLEKTFGTLHISPNSSMLKKYASRENVNNEYIANELEVNENEVNSYNLLDCSIIEILSDDDVDQLEKSVNKDDQYYGGKQILNNIKSEIDSKDSCNINQDACSFTQSHKNEKENCYEAHISTNKSIQFNDTIEEVEYILKKGMEYMATKVDSKESSNNTKISTHELKTQVSDIQPNLPMTYTKPVAYVPSPSKAKKTPYKYQSSSSKRFDIDIRPFPKLDIFTKPTIHSRHKELTSKQQKFSHIVSPIGTYMKKTARTPLMSTIHCQTSSYFNSTAILELENESRLYQPVSNSYASTPTEQAKLLGLASGSKRPLPKKAYISSDLKHIVDDRAFVTIPGGKKIQKYLENAMMPAVLRHEGKFKMPGGINNKTSTSALTSSGVLSKIPLKVSDTNSKACDRNIKSTSHVPRRNNVSLADLSLMSGDVSMYTIMDAQKF